MKIVNLEQGSNKWLEWRKIGLGSSEVHHLTDVAPWSNRDQLKRIKTGKEVVFKNAAMTRGNELEPIARMKVQEMTGMIFTPVCIVSDKYSWLKASLDGLNESGTIAVEIKCPTKPKVHQIALEGSPPDYYIPQLQYELLAGDGKIKKVIFVSYHPEFPIHQQLVMIDELPRPTYQEILMEECLKFVNEMNW